jgi:hypothetical protein
MSPQRIGLLIAAPVVFTPFGIVSSADPSTLKPNLSFSGRPGIVDINASVRNPSAFAAASASSRITSYRGRAGSSRAGRTWLRSAPAQSPGRGGAHLRPRLRSPCRACRLQPPQATISPATSITKQVPSSTSIRSTAEMWITLARVCSSL